MTRAHIRVLVTPGPATESLAEMLRGSVPVDVIEYTSASLSFDAHEHVNDEPAARVLTLIAHPGDTAAMAIAAGDDVEQALSGWSAAARRLLRQIQRHPARCLIIDANEALASPQLFVEALGRWDEVLRRLSPCKAEAVSSDPLAALLGRIAADNDIASRRLFAELQARCVVLTKLDVPTSPDWRAAVRHRQRDVEHRVAEQNEWSSRVEGLRGQLEGLQEDLARTRDDLDEWRQHAEASNEKRSLLALQLEQAQEELHVQQEELAMVLNKSGEWQRDAERSKNDYSVISLQLEQAQEELETLYKWRTRAQVCPELICAERLRFLDTSNSAPFRHLHIDLHRVHASDRHWDSLEVRLVEHHGRPGLAFFGTGQTREPLASWQASGREGIREFMLLVPSDTAGQNRLVALGTSDWRMVVGITDLLVRELPRIGGDVAIEWAFIARRLQADLQGIEARLRYDTCSMQEDGGPGGGYCVEFGEVMFGSQLLGNVRLRWQPETGELEWIAPDDGLPLPLSGWPVRGDRSHAAVYRIPTGRNDKLVARRGWWASQPARSRTLLLAILEALPEAARRRPETARFAVAAGTLLEEVRRWQRGRAWRTTVKFLLRRT